MGFWTRSRLSKLICNKKLTRIIPCIFALSLLLLSLAMPYIAHGQGATPIPINPPTATPSLMPPTALPSATPTSLGPASIEALADGTNVRSQPDITAERVGQISPGRTYPIVGRRFEWLQIQYPDAPGGIGFVHESVIQIIGDPERIPDLALNQVPTEDPLIAGRQQTAEAIAQTPGAVLTLTGIAQNAETNSAANSGIEGMVVGSSGGENAPNLPTYTFPASTATPINLGDFSSQTNISVGVGGVPPIAPIAGLIGLGGLGLLFAALRRG